MEVNDFGGRGVIGLYVVEGLVWCSAILWRLCGVLCVWVRSIGIGVASCLMRGRRFWWKMWICAWWCMFEMKD